MPIGSIFSLNFQGDYCGVPFSIVMAYRQVVDDEPGISPGRRLCEQWLMEVGGPWDFIRTYLSDQLSLECAVVTWDQQSETHVISAGDGLNAAASLPTSVSLQVNTPASDPHSNSSEGRFYMPGFPVDSDGDGVVDQAYHVIFDDWMKKLLNVDLDPGQARYVLYPHFKYTDRAGGQADQVNTPYYNSIWKVTGTRKADDCATFAATGAPQFSPIEVPAQTP